jgi:hypothetical protein
MPRGLFMCQTFQSSTVLPVLTKEASWQMGEDSFPETILESTVQWMGQEALGPFPGFSLSEIIYIYIESLTLFIEKLLELFGFHMRL